MRTNIELDDELLAQARRFARARTKRGVVEEALREFVQTRRAQEARTAYRERLEALQRRMPRGLAVAAHDLIREDRDRA